METPFIAAPATTATLRGSTRRGGSFFVGAQHRCASVGSTLACFPRPSVILSEAKDLSRTVIEIQNRSRIITSRTDA